MNTSFPRTPASPAPLAAPRRPTPLDVDGGTPDLDLSGAGILKAAIYRNCPADWRLDHPAPRPGPPRPAIEPVSPPARGAIAWAWPLRLSPSPVS